MTGGTTAVRATPVRASAGTGVASVTSSATTPPTTLRVHLLERTVRRVGQPCHSTLNTHTYCPALRAASGTSTTSDPPLTVQVSGRS